MLSVQLKAREESYESQITKLCFKQILQLEPNPGVTLNFFVKAWNDSFLIRMTARYRDESSLRLHHVLIGCQAIRVCAKRNLDIPSLEQFKLVSFTTIGIFLFLLLYLHSCINILATQWHI